MEHLASLPTWLGVDSSMLKITGHATVHACLQPGLINARCQGKQQEHNLTAAQQTSREKSTSTAVPALTLQDTDEEVASATSPDPRTPHGISLCETQVAAAVQWHRGAALMESSAF